MPERLDLAVLGQAPTLNAAEVAAETGVTIDQARRLWRALGFAEMGHERAFSTADVEAVSAMMSIIDSGTVDFDMAVNLTRGAGRRWRGWPTGRSRRSPAGSRSSRPATRRRAPGSAPRSA